MSLFSGVLLCYLVGSLFAEAAENITIIIIFSALLFFLFCYSVTEQVIKSPQIIMTTEGIEFRDNGFYRWSVIESFKTTRPAFYKNHKQYLILYLKESTYIQIDITDLELNSEEIVEQIFKFEDAADVIYKGSE